MQVTQIPVDKVVYREDLYPRIKTSPETVQKYAEDLSVLPPIEVNQHNELIDGWHRWTAHRKNGVENIAAIVVQTSSEAHLLELAIERNATHGLQLSQDDKRKMATRIYLGTPDKQRDAKKKELARVLSASEKTVSRWLSDIDKQSRTERNKRIFDMWLACHTQEEIAAAVGVVQSVVSDRFIEIGQLSISDKITSTTSSTSEADSEEQSADSDGKFRLSRKQIAAAQHATDFEPPLYNVWRKNAKTNEVEHPGNSEKQWVDNLLYLYTDPFDVVVDPFAGGGSTIDVCKKRFRRYYVSDRKPIVERESDIRKHDLVDGLPPVPRWKDVRLVYLDPPYWKQAEGMYGDDENNLANMSLESFTKTLGDIINGFAKKLSQAHIALIIQPTQWKAPERQFTDHIADMLRAVKLPLDMRFSAPYSTQQYNAQMIEWAKENKRCLVLTREIVVWRVG